MSIAAFRKEFRAEQKITKLEATRKQVKMRTKQQTQQIFNMDVIKQDSSENKVVSHRRLQSEIIKSSTYLEQRQFLRNDLIQLCEFYNVKYTKSMTKKQLSKKLYDPIKEHEYMPNTTETSNPSKKAKICYPCGACGEECVENCVACDKCETWFHGNCVKITDVSMLHNVDWLCKDCEN